MKYARKMKLVPFDDDSAMNRTHSDGLSDKHFVTPRVLSTLDGVMNEILRRSDLNDGDKWRLYNQSLQRYLNFVKRNQQKNDSVITPNHRKNASAESLDHLNELQSECVDRNDTIDTFLNQFSPNEISGIMPIRDSLDSISQPAVRSFFEKARESIPIPSHNSVTR